MRKNIYLKAVVYLFLIPTLLVSCSFKKTNIADTLNMSSENSQASKDTANKPVVGLQETKLPDIIELHYKEIKQETIPQIDNLPLLKKMKEVQLGFTDGEQINITLYSDEDNNIHGVFEYKGKKYILRNLAYASDIDLVKVDRLQLVYNINGKKIILVSGIGSPNLGYQYIFFDEQSNVWNSFHNWGTPKVIDLDQNGIKEVLLQFQGLHNNAPDLNILSLQNGSFMITDINDELYQNIKLDAVKSKISSTFIKEQNDKTMIQISDLMGKEAPTLYSLEYDEQNSSLLELRKELKTVN